MSRKFKMVEKGYKYRTDGYTLVKSWKRVRVHPEKYFSPMLAPIKTVASWTVYQDGKNTIYTFHTLKHAKQFIIDKDGE